MSPPRALFNYAVLWLSVWVALLPAQGASLAGYARALPPESASARVLRHARVAERRAGTALIAHRGASTLATENTLEAYAAAMDYGADGCEVDVRRTVDGVLVLFHDDMLDRLTDGFGKVEHLTYAELLALHPQIVRGTAKASTRPPTFAALLILARQRAMLFHLDVKEPGLDDDIARALDDADMWDHVVAINTGTVPILMKHPKLKLLRYKGGVYENRLDMDPAAVKAALAKPGQLLILEDPRVAARELNRPPYQPVSLPREVFARWKPAQLPSTNNLTELVPVRYLERLAQGVKPDSVEELLALLRSDDSPRRASTQRILERAWAAERLGQLGRREPRIVERLEFQVQHPGLHEDWLYNALDGHAAARALGRLRATASAPVLIETFRWVDPELVHFQNPQWTNNPPAWVDWRKMSILTVLGELRCDSAKIFLLEYVSLPESAARELSVPQFEEATRSLFRHELRPPEIEGLLRSTNSAVRGTAILECLDHPDRERTAALRTSAPWALDLPRARK